MTATEIAAAIRSGEVSALEVLDDHLRRIEARNPELNAIVVEDFERARAAAASPRPGALSGVPFTVICCQSGVTPVPTFSQSPHDS